MFVVECDTCQTTYLISTWSILTIETTDAGIITVVRCPKGHLTAINHRIGRARTRPQTDDPSKPAAEE